MMRKLTLTIGVCMLGAMLVATPASAKQHPMTGAWAGTDGDGSALHVTIGGGQNQVVYQDDGATVCLTTFGEFAKATGRAFGEITDNSITTTMDIDCHLSTGKTTWTSDLVLNFDYDPVTDTLSDDFGLCYHRPSRPGDCD